jgi:hypothetical protein
MNTVNRYRDRHTDIPGGLTDLLTDMTGRHTDIQTI